MVATGADMASAVATNPIGIVHVQVSAFVLELCIRMCFLCSWCLCVSLYVLVFIGLQWSYSDALVDKPMLIFKLNRCILT